MAYGRRVGNIYIYNCFKFSVIKIAIVCPTPEIYTNVADPDDFELFCRIRMLSHVFFIKLSSIENHDLFSS